MKRHEEWVKYGKRIFWYTVSGHGCHECFNYRRDKDGYPILTVNRKSTTIARFVFQAANGALDHGEVVRHTCDNRACINPEHLIRGTQRENIRDRDERGHGPVGERNGRAKLTERDVKRIREKLSQTLNRLADQYQVEIGAIQDIATRKLWKHVA